jgi:hypothetical protein
LDLSLSGIQKKLQSFRGTKWFDITVLVVLGLVVSGLFPITFGTFATACLGLLLIPVAIFVIPYWLGERSLKRFALNGVVVFVIAIVIIAVFYTDSSINSGDQIVGSAGISGLSTYISLENGSVTPFRGSPGQTFVYRVHLNTTGYNSSTPLTVYLNFTEFDVFTPTYSSFAMQREAGPANATSVWYSTNRTLAGNVYEFFFTANDTQGNFTATQSVLGPITASPFSFFLFWLYPVAFYLLIPLSFYYIILFMFWYTVRTRKLRTRMIEARQKDALDLDKGTGKGTDTGATDETAKAEEPKAAAEGKTKKAAAFTCTNCGADVTEDDSKCPKCGAVFES